MSTKEFKKGICNDLINERALLAKCIDRIKEKYAKCEDKEEGEYYCRIDIEYERELSEYWINVWWTKLKALRALGA